jgi:O-antigen/teichoic acid export membrane protein
MTVAYDEKSSGCRQIQGSSGRRAKRLATGIATTALSRGVGALAPLLLVPLTFHTLGPAVFGLWMSLAAVTSMVAFADLGLGNGLMTRLAPLCTSGDHATARRLISTSSAILSTAAIISVGVLFGLSQIVPWASLLNVEGNVDAGQTGDITLVCLTAFLLNIPASLVTRVQYAYQMVGTSNVWQSIGNLTSLALAGVAVACHLGPVAIVTGAISGPLAINVINGVWLFCFRMPALAPRVRDIDHRAANTLMRLSGRFFILTIVTAIATNADPLIIGQALSVSEVAVYAVAAKLFALLGMMINIINLPLWPANGDALAQGDLAWIRRTMRLMTLASTAGVAVVGIVLLTASASILADWLGPARDEFLLMAGLGVWWLVVATVSPRFMVQNAAGVVRPQLIGWISYLTLSLPIKWIVAQQAGIGFVALSGAAIYALTVVPSAMIGYRKAIALQAKRVTQ